MKSLRYGKLAAELIPVSASSPGKLFGRSKESTVILGDLLSTEEHWNEEKRMLQVIAL